jgi:tetratricopeptide (TPR) repeat protein
MQQDFFEPDCPHCQALEKEFKRNPDRDYFGWEVWEDEIDLASNHVLDLIEAGQFEAAEAAARELMKSYPDAVDGLERLAKVFEAKGDYSLAIQHYESAIAFTLVHDGFDEGSRDYLRDRIGELQKKLP